MSKEYKNIISQNVKKIKNTRIEKLRNLRYTNAKEYWSIINSVERKKKPLSPPHKDQTVKQLR